jgi:hypothetical protein
MAVIHRLLCTHCTFGSSELEPNTAENAAKVLGYSVRRSSLPEPDRGLLRTAFRAVERLLSYELPQDTPPAKKESLEAETAPRRLVFLPNLAGWQVAAHVAYRTRDTHGRIGSYFADVLASKLDRDSRPWSPLEVLQLWATTHGGSLSARWWCDSEEALAARDSDGRWKPADTASPTESRDTDPPLIDDALLHQFLKLEPGETVADPGAIVPPRWWSMASEQRRELLAALLNATIQSRRNGGKESMVIAAEPSVAALLFYGVFRLLPPRLREGIGFSTYEAAPDRPLTPLVATTFLEGEASTADLPPELLHRGFACNTFRDVARHGRTQAPPDNGYVRRVTSLAIAGEWGLLDGFLAALDGLPRLDFTLLDDLTRVDVYVSEYVAGDRSRKRLKGELNVTRGSEAERFRRTRFKALIDADHATRTAKWPRDLLHKAIDWLGDEFKPTWDSDGPAAEVLRRRLPRSDEELGELLAATKNARPAPWPMAAEAVVVTALASDPPCLPRSFQQFVAECEQGKGLDILPLVDEVLRQLCVVHSRPDLVASADIETLAQVLNVVTRRESQAQDSSGVLTLPLDDIVARAMKLMDTDEKRVAFLVRHAALADAVRRTTRSPALTDLLRSFFDTLLGLVGSEQSTHSPGNHLAARGRSRTNDLLHWLLCDPSTSIHESVMSAWKDVHDALTTLNNDAVDAGILRHPKPTLEALRKFDNAYARIRDIVRNRRLENLPLFLRASFDGLAINERPRKTILKWLDRHANPTGRAQARANGRLIMAACAASLLAVGGGGIAWYWLSARDEVPPQASDKSPTAERNEQASDPGQHTPPKAPTTQPLTPGPGTRTVSIQPAKTAELTQELLGLEVKIHRGQLVVIWDEDNVKKAKASLTLLITQPDEASPAPTKLAVTSGTYSVNATKAGTYTVAATAISTSGTTKVTEDAVLEPLPKVTVEHPQVVVDQDGKPFLVASATKGDISQYGQCFFSLRDASKPLEPVGEHQVCEPTQVTQQIRIPLTGILTPDAVRSGTFTLAITTTCVNGPPSECFQITGTDLKTALLDKLKKKTEHGVENVCALPDSPVASRSYPLLDLPWFISATGSELDLELLTPSAVTDQLRLELAGHNTANQDPSVRRQWTCHASTSPDKPIGLFEIYCPQDSWRPQLRFQAPGDVADESTYELLKMCKLCLLESGRQTPEAPIATLQLLQPSVWGSIVIDTGDIGSDAPKLIAPTPSPLGKWFAAEKFPRDRERMLWSPAEAAQSQDDLSVSFGDSPHKSHGQQLGILCIRSTASTARLGVGIPQHKKSLLELDQWFLFTHDEESDKQPASVNQLSKARDSYTKAVNKLAAAEAHVIHAADRLKEAKEPEKKRLTDAHTDALAARNDAKKTKQTQEQKQDDFRPHYELLDLIESKQLTLAAWRLKWNVTRPRTSDGDDIPGGLSVIAVIGQPDGKPEVRFQPPQKNGK